MSLSEKRVSLVFGTIAIAWIIRSFVLEKLFPGLDDTIIAIIAVVLGGLGNILGSLIGGLILGLIGNIVMYIHPGLSLIAYYIIFLLLLLIKPTGIFGK
jgi:branched-chain amino acid transport system permease protein